MSEIQKHTENHLDRILSTYIRRKLIETLNNSLINFVKLYCISEDISWSKKQEGSMSQV